MTGPGQEIWRCMREKGVPKKYAILVKDVSLREGSL